LTLGLLPILGQRTQILLRAFANFGDPLVLFGVQGLKINLYFEGIFPFEESPKLKFYCGALAHFEGLLDPFVVQGLNVLHNLRFSLFKMPIIS
jgi:hypothetical protein